MTAHVTRVAPPEPHHDRCPTPLNEHTRPCSGSHCSVYGNARCVFRLDDILPSHVRSETCSSTSTIYNLIRASCDHTRTHLYTTTYVTHRQYRRINRIQKVVISFCVCMKGWELTRARANVNHSPPLPASHLLRHPSSVSYHSSRPNPPPRLFPLLRPPILHRLAPGSATAPAADARRRLLAGSNPGPSACDADAIPLDHVPDPLCM